MNRKMNFASHTRASALALAVLSLSACTSIGYRCPLDPTETPDSPIACAGMPLALKGAKAGTGGSVSALLDDKGRLVPRELIEGRPATPLSAVGSTEPYRNKSGDPVFEPPKKFEVWASAFVDGNGNLHDGHHAWFTTPGRWKYGTVGASGPVGDNTLRPALPTDLPSGRIVKKAENGQATGGVVVNKPGPNATQKDKDQAALQSLSAAAKNVADRNTSGTGQVGQPTPVSSPAAGAAAGQPASPTSVNTLSAPGVTAPAVSLGQ